MGRKSGPARDLPPGTRRADRNYALTLAPYIIIAVAILVIGFAAVAPSWIERGYDVRHLAEVIFGGGVSSGGILGILGWYLREKRAPQLGGIQREVGDQSGRLRAIDERMASSEERAAGMDERVANVGQAVMEIRRDLSALTRWAMEGQRHEAVQPPPPPAPTWQQEPATRAWVPLEQPPLPEEPEAEPGRGHRSWGLERPKTGEFDAIILGRGAHAAAPDDPSLPDYLRGR